MAAHIGQCNVERLPDGARSNRRGLRGENEASRTTIRREMLHAARGCRTCGSRNQEMCPWQRTDRVHLPGKEV